MGMFDTWKSDKNADNILVGLIVVMLIMLYWIYATFSQANYAILASQAQIYIGFTIVGLLFFLGSKIMPQVGFASVGTTQTAFIAIIGAVILSVIMVAGGAKAIAQSTAFSVSEAELSGLASLIGTFYVIFSAPTAEELFFRGALLFTLINLLKDKYGQTSSVIISAVVVSLVFAGFHYFVYGADVDFANKMFGLVLFSLIAIAGNFIFKSIAFSLGFHYLNNLASVLQV